MLVLLLDLLLVEFGFSPNVSSVPLLMKSLCGSNWHCFDMLVTLGAR